MIDMYKGCAVTAIITWSMHNRPNNGTMDGIIRYVSSFPTKYASGMYLELFKYRPNDMVCALEYISAVNRKQLHINWWIKNFNASLFYFLSYPKYSIGLIL